MTKFLQRLQLALWAVAILVALGIELSGQRATLAPSVLYQFLVNMVAVVLLLVAGYCVMAQRRHRVVRMVAVNTSLFFSEVFYLLQVHESTLMYSALIAVLLSLASYPISEPKQDEPTPDTPQAIPEESAE